MALVKYNNRSILNVTALDSIASGGLNLITTNTISSGVSSSSFTSNIDSTYDTYLFKFISIHGATDNILFTFNLSVDGGSNYNVTKTSTFFTARHREDDSAAILTYQTGSDLAQSTGYKRMFFDSGIASDDASSGELFLFSPSNTTFVKHFIGRFSSTNTTPQNYDNYFAGYGNTTSAVNAIDFKFSSGNIDSGVIKMYGLSKS
tara:strand:- start:483 stop:1094 length:612 start_codon:yes stop_codon:yes gene_type:complete